ncbi:MAG: hypothetical protein JWO13_896 [Acidobacteriales bacterium]|nr:hypothetical protein [Terriglobales bacterium]
MIATAAVSQTTYSNIDQMSGFGSCTTCAGAGANGTTATFWMKQGLSSPSMDGKAAQFFLGGNIAYSDAMWWKKLPVSTSTASTLHHFIYDAYFYYKNSTAVQGLEFNITQYFGGKGFTYGMTCDVRNTKTWKISVADTSSSSMTGMHWQSTGIACPAPPTNKWNHVVIEAERTSSNQIHYLAVTLNGVKHYINKSTPYRTAPSSWGGITTHIQLNGNQNQDDYSVWMDKYKVTLW